MANHGGLKGYMRRTSKFWENSVYTLFANDPKEERGDAEVFAKTLEGSGGVPKPEQDGRPSARTIRDMRTRYRALKEEERESYRFLRWPESFVTGVLPWSAQRAALELVGQLKKGAAPRRPTVSEVRWYCRLTDGAPGASKEHRRWFAFALSSMELNGKHGTKMHEYISEWLTDRPWELSEARHHVWVRMRAGDPDFPTEKFNIGWKKIKEGGKWQASTGSPLWLDVFVPDGGAR